MDKLVFLFGLALYGASAFSTEVNINENLPSNNYWANDGQFPYMVSLQKRRALLPSMAHVCGGVLVTLLHVVTAASCLYDNVTGTLSPIDANEYEVFAGDRNINNVTDPYNFGWFRNYTIHPNFQMSPVHLNDIGIINIMNPFYESDRLKALPLPAPFYRPEETSSNCTVSGWGPLETGGSVFPILKYARKTLLTQTECSIQYPQLFDFPAVDMSMVCAAPSENLITGCAGDEGNPLVCNGQLVGILFHSNGCGASTHPELYTRVSNYTTWIQEVIDLSTSSSSTFQPGVALVFVITVAQIVTSKFNN